MVFQSYALFNHMTVAENIKFGLEVRRGMLLQTVATATRREASVQLPSAQPSCGYCYLPLKRPHPG